MSLSSYTQAIICQITPQSYNVEELYTAKSADFSLVTEVNDVVFALCGNSELWQSNKEDDQPILERVFQLSNVRVIQIACNNDVAFVITDMGDALCWGYDESKSGLLGHGEVYQVNEPSVIRGLTSIKQVSLAKNHGAAVNFMGELFTWGSCTNGQMGTGDFCQFQPPTQVSAVKSLCIKSVLCGPKSTVMCTEGGFVYVYGLVGGYSSQGNLNQYLETHHPNAPYTLTNLLDTFVTSVALGEFIVAVLTDKGEICAFDDSSEVIQLPSNPNTRIFEIGSNGINIFGLGTEDCILQWSPPAFEDIEMGQSNSSSLKLWTLDEFSLKNSVQFTFGATNTPGRLALLGSGVMNAMLAENIDQGSIISANSTRRSISRPMAQSTPSPETRYKQSLPREYALIMYNALKIVWDRTLAKSVSQVKVHARYMNTYLNYSQAYSDSVETPVPARARVTQATERPGLSNIRFARDEPQASESPEPEMDTKLATRVLVGTVDNVMTKQAEPACREFFEELYKSSADVSVEIDQRSAQRSRSPAARAQAPSRTVQKSENLNLPKSRSPRSISSPSGEEYRIQVNREHERQRSPVGNQGLIAASNDQIQRRFETLAFSSNTDRNLPRDSNEQGARTTRERLASLQDLDFAESPISAGQQSDRIQQSAASHGRMVSEQITPSSVRVGMRDNSMDQGLNSGVQQARAIDERPASQFIQTERTTSIREQIQNIRSTVRTQASQERSQSPSLSNPILEYSQGQIQQSPRSQMTSSQAQLDSPLSSIQPTYHASPMSPFASINRPPASLQIQTNSFRVDSSMSQISTSQRQLESPASPVQSILPRRISPRSFTPSQDSPRSSPAQPTSYHRNQLSGNYQRPSGIGDRDFYASQEHERRTYDVQRSSTPQERRYSPQPEYSGSQTHRSSYDRYPERHPTFGPNSQQSAGSQVQLHSVPQPQMKPAQVNLGVRSLHQTLISASKPYLRDAFTAFATREPISQPVVEMQPMQRTPVRASPPRVQSPRSVSPKLKGKAAGVLGKMLSLVLKKSEKKATRMAFDEIEQLESEIPRVPRVKKSTSKYRTGVAIFVKLLDMICRQEVEKQLPEMWGVFKNWCEMNAERIGREQMATKRTLFIFCKTLWPIILDYHAPDLFDYFQAIKLEAEANQPPVQVRTGLFKIFFKMLVPIFRKSDELHEISAFNQIHECSQIQELHVRHKRERSATSNKFLTKSAGMIVKVVEGVIKDKMIVLGHEFLERVAAVQHARKWGKHKHILQNLKMRLRQTVNKILTERFKRWKLAEKPERPIEIPKSRLNQYQILYRALCSGLQRALLETYVTPFNMMRIAELARYKLSLRLASNIYAKHRARVLLKGMWRFARHADEWRCKCNVECKQHPKPVLPEIVDDVALTPGKGKKKGKKGKKSPGKVGLRRK